MTEILVTSVHNVGRNIMNRSSVLIQSGEVLQHAKVAFNIFIKC